MTTRHAFTSLLVLALLVAGGLWLRARQRRSQRLSPDTGSFEIVPESVSRERAARVLPVTGSEDAAHLLQPIQLKAPARAAGTDDYPPDPATDWVVEVALPPGSVLQGPDVQEAFAGPWLKEHGGAVLHGYVPKNAAWTYVGAQDAPEPYSKVALAKSLVHTDRLGEQELATVLSSVVEKAKAWPGARVSSSETPAAAAARAARLRKLQQAYDLAVIITLRAPAGARFDGRKVWDVMLSVGLQWGDMDLFHWKNESGIGDDYWFSVSTSTAPGYFLPEQIAAGAVQVDDLVFSFSIPRSGSPAAALDRMLAAARYARSRLGGELLGTSGAPFDPESIQHDLAQIEAELTAAGFPPGADPTLHLF